MKQYDIIIGIPSFNEEERIGFVVKQVDKGLVEYFSEQKCLIVNTDGGSDDQTRKVFSDVKTDNDTQSILAEGVSGKGSALKTFFEKAVQHQPEALAVVDSDLKSIEPVWIKKLINPVSEGFDYVAPLYKRGTLDGTITNHVVYPLMYGLVGKDIRQPIGGEFAFSSRFIQHLLVQEWTEEIRKFGIDIFMSFNAALGDYKIFQTVLGTKVHKPSAPNLASMFLEVVTSAFTVLLENKASWLKQLEQVEETEVAGSFEEYSVPEAEIDLQKISDKSKSEFESADHDSFLPPDLQQSLDKIFSSDKPQISTDLWVKLVYELILSYDKNKDKRLIRFMRALYYARICEFAEAVKKESHSKSEQRIIRQAKIFFENRDCLLNKYKKEQ